LPALADGLSATFRALSFIALFQAAGMAIFFALFGRLLTASGVLLRRAALGTAVLALAFVVVQYGLEAARMSGELSGVFDSSMQGLVLQSSTAAAFAWRLAGLAILLAGLRARSDAGALLSLLGATLVLCSFALVGHTSSHPHRWALSLLLLTHLAIVAFWFGALVPLSVASRRESPSAAAEITDAFSRLALSIVPVLVVAGLVLAALILKDLSALRTTYGQLLLVKFTGFALLMGLAALNKWYLGPALKTGDPRVGVLFRRSLGAEYALIAAVLAVTAVLTTFYSPE